MWKYKIVFDKGTYYVEGYLKEDLSLKYAKDAVYIIISQYEGMGLDFCRFELLKLKSK